MRIAAQILSILFHPLFIILYLLFILLTIDPASFSLEDSREKIIFFTYTFVNTLIIPVIAIFIMKMLGMVKSLEMKDAKERVGPLIVIGSLYLWLFINFKNNPAIPDLLVSILLGSIFAVFIAFFINNFSKISLHMLGLGGMVMALFLMKIQLKHDFFFVSMGDLLKLSISIDFLLILSILISGLTGSARLYLKAHRSSDLFGGFLVGILSQIIAYKIIF